MANSKQAEKRIRQIKTRTARNRDRVSRIRTFVRKAEEAIASGDKSAAEAAFKAAMPEMQRGVTKGVLHKKTVSRKISRMAAAVKAL